MKTKVIAGRFEENEIKIIELARKQEEESDKIKLNNLELSENYKLTTSQYIRRLILRDLKNKELI